MCNLSENIMPAHSRIFVDDQSSGQKLLHEADCLQLNRDGLDGSRENGSPARFAGYPAKKSGVLLGEHLMNVYINDRLTMKLVCIPEYLPELVTGRLLTEGIIRTAGDVKAIHIREYGTHARVYLNGTVPKNDISDDFVELTSTSCTSNHILNNDFQACPDLCPVTPIPWKVSWIFSLADRFAEGMPLHRETWCTHSCFLAMEDRLLFQCEDIGRHNALDKAIGYALLHEIDLTRCIIYSSGRIPTDMAQKAIRAGIPILSGKASPTREAVDLAEKYHLTLICNARRDSMKLYAGEPPV